MADQEDPSSGSVVCLGEAMAQIVPTDGLRLDAAQEFAVGLAGAESNVAISLARGSALHLPGPALSVMTRSEDGSCR